MKEIKITDEIKLVFSEKTLGFKEVLNEFENAEFIVVVTYNISIENEELLKKLKEASTKSRITIITNIPGRWNHYFKDTLKDSAIKNINLYYEKLNPKNFSSSFQSFYNFNNHSKIIMTNNIAYIGSANFSSESKNNFESGIIIKDSKAINKINSEIISYLKAKSIEHTSKELEEYELIFSKLLKDLLTTSYSFYECFFGWPDIEEPWIEVSGNCYGVPDKEFTEDIFEEIISILDFIEEEVEELKKIYNLSNIKFETKLINIGLIRDFFFNRFLSFAKFSVHDYINSQMSITPTMEELTEKYSSKFQDEAYSILQNFYEELEGDVNDFGKKLKKIYVFLKEIINEISNQKYNYSKINNTKQ